MPFRSFVCSAIALAALPQTISPQCAAAKPLSYTGVNLAGGEFFDPVKTPDPVYGKNFTYPTLAEFQYFSGKGMNVVRIPFRWETLQPEAKKPLRDAEVKRLRDVVDQAANLGLIVLLDPHNYARYYDKVVGSQDVPDDVFADFWRRMAMEFKGNKRVWFGLVNEPHDMPTEQWVNAANAAIASIRAAGSNNRILVPGNAWTGTAGWYDTWYGGPNSEWMLKIVDPAKNYRIEVHCYLDKDGSGSHAEVVSPAIGVERTAKFTAWCREHHLKAFLGEVGVAGDEQSHTALENMLTAMEQAPDVWDGFTWWAAGAWWGDYMYTLEPKDGMDRPQLAWLEAHLAGKKDAER